MPLGYLALSLAFFGPGVVLNLDSVAVGKDEFDPSGFIWCLAWWPNALLDGLDPFVTQHLFVPEGYNLTWAASVPGPALLLAPITLLTSATVSYNVIMLLSPPLAAWAAYALCRHVSGAFWPAVIGGYLFGFSPYMLGTLRGGAPNLSFVALLPVMVLLVLRRAEGSLGPRPFVGLMAGALVLQLSTGSEVIALATLFGLYALVLAWVLMPEQRPALRRVAGGLVLAFAAAGLVLSPFLISMLRPHVELAHVDPTAFVNDLESLVVPTPDELGGGRRASWWSALGIDSRVGGPGYLGLPLIGIVAAFAWQHRADRRARLVLLCAVSFLVASLGPRLWVAGAPRIPMPWELFVHLPLYRYAIPMRFAAFTFLAVALILALWLAARPHSRGRWALAAVALLVLTPNAGAAIWRSPAPDPAFFRTDLWKAEISPRDRVMTIPIWGRGTRWAARTQIGFRLAGGYVGFPPPSYSSLPTWQTFTFGRTDARTPRELRRFVALKGVTLIVVERQNEPRWRSLLATLGASRRESGGVVLYRLRPPPA